MSMFFANIAFDRKADLLEPFADNYRTLSLPLLHSPNERARSNEWVCEKRKRPGLQGWVYHNACTSQTRVF